jgi:histidinol phosphatase-like enzyme
VIGAPTPKSVAVKSLIRERLIDPSLSIFIGDAQEDYLAASSNAVRFLLRETKENQELFRNFKGQRVKNFLGQEEVIREELKK